jgi:enoyl-CoA hydratase/carnithine racemase
MSDVVKFERVQPHVALVTLNRPEARNAINSEVALAFAKIYDEIENDPDIWVAILTGTGGQAFCAGADLKEIASVGLQSLIDACAKGFDRFTRKQHTKPWIAAVNGFAMGGGTEFALGCDMIVAGDGAHFGVPEVKRGLMALGGGVIGLPRVIPRNVALEYIATGAAMPARRAYELGLANRVVPADQVIPEAIKLAEAICENSPYCVRESLKLARIVPDKTADELWALNATAAVAVMKSEDYQEGPRAFAEKRKPNWTGR